MAQHAWEVLASAEAAGLGVNELLKGLAPSIVAKLGEKTEEKHQKQAEANELVIRGIACSSRSLLSVLSTETDPSPIPLLSQRRCVQGV